MSGRLLRIALLVSVLSVSSAPVTADQACQQDLQDLQRVTEMIVLSDQTQRAVQQLWQSSKQACSESRLAEARSELSEAWAAVLGDERLLVPTVAEVARGTCDEGMQTVEARMEAAEVGEVARDAAGTLVDDAKQLCAAEESLAAQDKLAMAWTMLEGR